MKTEVLYLIIGQAIREAREARHLTQEDLAAAVGIQRTSIVNAEAGNQRIQIDTLYRIAVHLDKPLDYFLPKPTPDLFDPIEDAFQKFLKSIRNHPV